MEQLVSMRQRIKSVQTIQKITQAMRLISISNHSRLNSKKLNLEKYKESLFELYMTIQANLRLKGNRPIPSKSTGNNSLVVLVGSQKGLSGTFNAHLFKFFEKNYHPTVNDHFITVGKLSTDYLKKIRGIEPTLSFDIFNAVNFLDITYEITNHILQHNLDYKSILLFANHPKTFFLQEPSRFILLPFQEIDANNTQKKTSTLSDYNIVEPHALIDSLEKIILTTLIQNSLFNSLLAEQAARFLSMDTATRNAENLIIEMQTNYNKVRQAAITKELTEVTAGLGS